MKYRRKFIQQKTNNLEMDPVAVVSSPNKLPEYTYGGVNSGEANENSFPMIRKTIQDFLNKEGVGVAADVSTPTCGGSEGEGKEIDFFNTKKAKIYVGQGKNPPKDYAIQVGPRKGRFYETKEKTSGEKDTALEDISNAFQTAGYSLYEVGGSVRDRLLGKDSDDIDLTTNSTPAETKKILSASNLGSVFDIGEEYGTIGIQIPNGKKIEITTFRDEVYPADSRKPKVTYGNSLEKDLSRRDFTINAIAVDLQNNKIVDPLNGASDLKNGIIRVIGGPERFDEDPLRMLRAVRFACQLGFDKMALEMPHPEKLNNISKERISSELNKILLSQRAKFGIELLRKYGLMKYIIPDFEKMYDLKQNKWHKYDAFNHTLDVLDKINDANGGLEKEDKLVLSLSALLHDIGKPDTKTEEQGEIHFYGHEDISTKLTENILKDLKYDNSTIDRVSKLVSYHMKPMQAFKSGKVEDKFVKRMIYNLGAKDAGLLVRLYAADASSSNFPSGSIPDDFQKVYDKIIADKASEVKSPLSGGEIMETFSLKAGRKIGDIKDFLINQAVEGNLQPEDKEKAYEMVKDFLDSESVINKAKAYIREGEKPPKGVVIQRGPRGGYFYETGFYDPANLIPETIIAEMLADWKKDGFEPEDINGGLCLSFAKDLVEKLGGGEIFYIGGDENNPLHAFVKYDDKFYDPENPEGKKNWKELNLIKRERMANENLKDRTEGLGEKTEQYMSAKEKDNFKKIEKAKIYLSPGEKPPKGIMTQRGPRGGLYYEGLLPGVQYEKETVKQIEWQRPLTDKTPGGLTIPKTWQKDYTFVNTDPKGTLQATSLDQKGRRVYLRSAVGIEKGRAKKFKRLKTFRNDIPRIVKILDKDVPKKEEAQIIQLLFKTGFRVGSKEETTGDVKSYGISTLLRKHVTVKGNNHAVLDFPGKDGVRNYKEIRDPWFVQRVSKIKDPQQRIFNTDYGSILGYLRKITGKPYKNHDFRTLMATSTAIEVINKMPKPESAKGFRKFQIEVGKIVAATIGNTYAIALSSYISPDVWTPIEAGLGITMKKASDYFQDIDEMLQNVEYEDMDSGIEKAKIYLSPSDTPPPGKKVQFGPKGGRYYDTALEVYRHLWQRVKERKMREEKIIDALNFLESKNLPNFDWYFRIEGAGIIVGQADKVQTVLKLNMRPAGAEIKRE